MELAGIDRLLTPSVLSVLSATSAVTPFTLKNLVESQSGSGLPRSKMQPLGDGFVENRRRSEMCPKHGIRPCHRKRSEGQTCHPLLPCSNVHTTIPVPSPIGAKVSRKRRAHDGVHGHFNRSNSRSFNTRPNTTTSSRRPSQLLSWSLRPPKNHWPVESTAPVVVSRSIRPSK
jgi:hypothetical protein